jgi:hypothetical protein
MRYPLDKFEAIPAAARQRVAGFDNIVVSVGLAVVALLFVLPYLALGGWQSGRKKHRMGSESRRQYVEVIGSSTAVWGRSSCKTCFTRMICV